MRRLFDMILTVLASPLLVPLFILVSLMVWIKLGTPVFYRQERGGLHGRRFQILKFRSMIDARDAEGKLLPDEERLQPFGKLLRSTSLDELPCFWNVLKGDMALVGPRPFIADYLDLYTVEQMRRHDTRPGITGWAQINGRNAVSWEEKFELDLWYVDNRSIWLDIKILLLTVKRVLIRHGVSSEDDVTMPRFTGTKRT